MVASRRWEEALGLLEACLAYACPEEKMMVFLDEGKPM